MKNENEKHRKLQELTIDFSNLKHNKSKFNGKLNQKICVHEHRGGGKSLDCCMLHKKYDLN